MQTQTIAYSTEAWNNERLKARQEHYIANSFHKLDKYIEFLENTDSFNQARFYDSLSTTYIEIAENYYIEADDIEATRWYLYLAAKTGEKAILYNNQMVGGGIDSPHHGSLLLSACALLANKEELALQLAPPYSPFRALLKSDAKEAHKSLIQSSDGDYLSFQRGYWALIHKNKKCFCEELINRILVLRKSQGYPIILDICGLSLLKIAKRMEFDCDINLVELPLSLLINTQVDESQLKFTVVGMGLPGGGPI